MLDLTVCAQDTLQLCEVVHVIIQMKVGGKNVDLFVVPHIYEPLTKKPISKMRETFPTHNMTEAG